MAAVADVPTELLVFFFVLLSFRDRVRVSHVSRRWRAVATEHTELGNRLAFHHRPEHRTTFLAALRRAGALPLEATWMFNAPQSAGFDILEANISRIRVLSVQGYCADTDLELLDRLLARPLPLLEEFHIEKSLAFNIPQEWTNGGAPRLREIALSRFNFHPTSGRFRALRCFRGSVQSYSYGPFYPSRIFELCPALAELELSGINGHLLRFLAEGQIPLTLTRLVLLPSRSSSFEQRGTLDYEPLLHMLGRMPAFLAITLASDVSSAAKHYVAHVRTQFRATCTIHHSQNVYDTDAFDVRLDNGGLQTLTCNMTDLRAALNSAPNLVPHFDNLAQLECATEFFERLLRVSPTLPSLHSLTLLVSGGRPHGDPNYCHFQRAGRLVAPRLRSLAVDSSSAQPGLAFGTPLWFARALPATAADWLRFDAPRLETAYCYMHRCVRSLALRPEELLSWAARAFVGWRADWERGLAEQGTWYTDQGAVSV
ncbi:hypothetical protein AURDEDRAFT_116507 [Auricularia subglabra TFB-10046 SS5]|nr:hypothetical protein AURDEDRAFT_116507 [Auricularia subglabra TFB-10046 SS5]